MQFLERNQRSKLKKPIKTMHNLEFNQLKGYWEKKRIGWDEWIFAIGLGILLGISVALMI